MPLKGAKYYVSRTILLSWLGVIPAGLTSKVIMSGAKVKVHPTLTLFKMQTIGSEANELGVVQTPPFHAWLFNVISILSEVKASELGLKIIWNVPIYPTLGV